MSRYTISQLYSEVDRYHVRQLYLDGVLGRTEIDRDMLPTIIQDGLSSPATPHTTSPWMLVEHRAGVGVLRPNPGGRRRRDGLRGRVLLSIDLPRKGLPSAGSTRSREVWRGRTPISDAPFAERIKSRRSRRRVLNSSQIHISAIHSPSPASYHSPSHNLEDLNVRVRNRGI